MGEFGQALRQLRETQGLSPERASVVTRVPVHHLLALEAEQFQELPSNASARGFIRLLARLYKADEPALIRQFESALASAGPIEPPIPLSQTNATIFRAQPSRSHAGLSVGVGAVAVILLALAWMRGNQEPIMMTVASAPASKAPAKKAVAPRPSPEAKAEAPAPEPPITQPATVTGSEAAPAATSPADAVSSPAPAVTPEFRLEIQANEQSWVQATVDGSETREALLQAGERLEWTAREAMDVTLGNAGGLILSVNGEASPVLGESGQVVRLRATRDGIEKVRRFRTAPRPETLPPSALAF
ncbi:MAG: RodZ domain-containing protein [Nitrospirota bacterium]